MASLLNKISRPFSGIRLIFTALILISLFMLPSCEDDPILDATTDEDCVGSYCLLVEPSAENREIKITVNPEEF